MKLFQWLIAILASGALNTALGDSRYMPRTLDQLLEDCAVVAEVRVEWIRVQRAPNEKFDDLFCECTVLQGFKLPVITNRLILRLNFAGADRIYYEQKTAVLFAFENRLGGFTPLGGKRGLVLTNQVFFADIEVSPKKYANTRRGYKYEELIREIKRIIEANKHRAVANRKAVPPGAKGR
jgi:hypothetical protein